MDQIEAIVREVMARLAGAPSGAPVSSGGAPTEHLIPAEMSARHVHLSREDLKALFGLEELECVREISQPGQYLSGSRVRLIGPKGILDNVAVLGPTRGATQVEISATDARTLGVQAPVRLSGDLKDAAVIAIQAGSTVLTRKAAIIAQRHLHMTPADAAALGITNGQRVCVRVHGSRPLVLEDCPVRVSEAAATALHIDTDEANAAGLGKDGRCEIVGCAAPNGALARAPEHAKAEEHAPACSAVAEKLITEAVVRKLKAEGVTALCLRKGQLITPLARDTAKALGISITYGG